MELETDEDRGERIWEDPLDWLSGGRGGIEFAFDFGLSLRAGLSSFTTFQSVTAGAGLTIAKFVKIDYAFESHPVLSPVHRVSVSISPYLFSHSPKSGTPAASAPAKVLTEEPEETDAYEEMERVPEEQPTETSSTSAEAASHEETSSEPAADAPVPPSTPIVESDDEILE